jgi:hypothetical protein
MSPNEREFIRTYVLALRRDYQLFNCVLAITHPDGLAVADFLVAVRLGLGLQALHTEFETEVFAVAERRGITPKKFATPGPTFGQLAHWFELSFFKVLLSLQHNSLLKKQEEGWCSGQPIEWKEFFKTLAEECLLDDELDLPDSKILESFSKFLPPWQQKSSNPWPDWWAPGQYKKFPPAPPQYEPEEWDDYDDEEDDEYGSI